MRKIMFVFLLFLLASEKNGEEATQAKKGVSVMRGIIITSPAFKHMRPIPEVHTCNGADISPPLEWSELPAETKSVVLICDDPDAPRATWVHWVVYDMPPTCRALPQGVEKTTTLTIGGEQGKNDFQKIGYDGPCPPGGTHRYFFKVYALDKRLDLPAGKTKREVEKAMKGHILAQGEVIGTYSKKQRPFTK